jgi:putative inorganic carbon (hco3(-)) transporter
MEVFTNLKSKATTRVRPGRSGRLLPGRLNNTLFVFFIALLPLVFGFLMAKNLAFGLSLFAAIFGLFIVVLCISNPETGFYILIVFSFFINYLLTIATYLMNISLPVGLFFDILVCSSVIGVIISRKDFRKNLNQFTRNSLVVIILCTLFFSCIQFFNPNSPSTSDNIQAVRKFIGYVLVMFLAYTLLDSYPKVKKFTRFLFIVALISALYGCKQKIFGFFDYEYQVLTVDPLGWGLVFNNGDIRISSTMSDPAAFGIAMSVCAVFFLIMAMHESRQFEKFVLGAGSAVMIVAMGYSGTRTAYAILIVGLAFYIMLNIHKRTTRIFATIGVPILLFILYAPIYGNLTIQRFRTTFKGSDDQSYKVRVLSRAFIQPYIRRHPIGGGMGTTGFEGAKNHPGHYLAMFQPDSGYVKRAAETGWSGLIVICILYTTALVMSIKGYFRTKNEQVKVIAACCASSLFAFYIAEFTQQAIGQMTDVVIYYPILAILLRLKQYDSENPQKEGSGLTGYVSSRK